MNSAVNVKQIFAAGPTATEQRSLGFTDKELRKSVFRMLLPCRVFNELNLVDAYFINGTGDTPLQ